MNNNISNQKFQSHKVRPNCPPGFMYLKAKNKVNKCDPENAKCLESNCKPIPGSIIVRDLSYNSEFGLFHYFPDISALDIAVSPNSVHRLEEFIGINCPQRPKYDVDNFADDTILNIIIILIQREISMIWLREPEIAICYSSGIDSETGIHKSSCHIIVLGCLFKNAADACEISLRIQAALIKIVGAKLAKCYDHAVNNGSAHSLRTPLSTKNGRVKQVPAGYMREDLLITAGFQPGLRILDVTHAPKPEVIGREFIDADTGRVLELAKEFTFGWSPKTRVGNIIPFTRSRTAQKYCNICCADHCKDNSLYVLITPTAIRLGCFKMKDKSIPYERRFPLIAGNTAAGITASCTRMIEDKPIRQVESNEIIIADIAKIMEESGMNHHGYMLVNRIGNYLNFAAPINTWCMLCKCRHDTTDSVRILLTKRGAYYHCAYSAKEMIVFAFNTIHDIIKQEYPPAIIGNILEQSIIYDEPFLYPFPTDAITTYVRSNTGTGKTKAAKEYATATSIVIISFRKTYTRNMEESYNRGRPDDAKFVSYDSFEGQINLKKHPFIFIQAESLGRLKFKHPPQLLILDESESIFDEFKSDTMKNARQCADALEWLMKLSARCLAMDANLGPRTFEHIRRERGTIGELFIQNKYKSRYADKVMITIDRATLVKNILVAIDHGKNIVIPTNCKEFADDIYAEICKRKPGISSLKITSETPDKEKIDIFKNVATEWIKYQAIIYTPTCTAGISFEAQHFDAVYSYFTNNSCTVETCHQMNARVRDLKLKEYHVCIDTKYNAERECSLQEFRRSVQRSANMITKEAKEYRDLQHTRPRWVGDKYIASEYDNNLLFDIVTHAVHIQNKTRTSMLRLFISQCREAGATVFAVDAIDRLEAKYIHANTKENKRATTELSAESILVAPEISDVEQEYLSKKPEKTDADGAAIAKFWLRQKYNYSGKITKDFIINYNKDKTIKIFENIRDITINIKTIALQELKDCHGWNQNKIMESRYPRHYVANELLRLIGYDSITDTRILTNATLSGNIAKNYEEIRALNDLLPAAFGPGKKLFPQGLGKYIRSTLDIVNGIFTSVYGFSVTSTTKRKQVCEDYIIDHKYLGVFFATEKSDIIPYILVYRGKGPT